MYQPFKSTSDPFLLLLLPLQSEVSIPPYYHPGPSHSSLDSACPVLTAPHPRKAWLVSLLLISFHSRSSSFPQISCCQQPIYQAPSGPSICHCRQGQSEYRLWPLLLNVRSLHLSSSRSFYTLHQNLHRSTYL